MPLRSDISWAKREIMILYNKNLLNHQLDKLGLTGELLAAQAGISVFSAYMALNGRLGTLRMLKKVADVLLIKWEYITQVDLPEKEFHRAVLTNGDRRGRTVKSGPVSGSANRPRLKELTK